VSEPGDSWQAANDAYLGASLHWLRLLLDRSAGRPVSARPPTAARPVAAPARRARRFGLRRTAHEAPPPPQPAALPLVATVTDEEVDTAATARERAASGSMPALVELADRLGMTPFERDLVLLCAAVELDPSAAARCARAQGDAALAFPTFALALSILPDPTWDAISPHRPPRFWRLIDVRTAVGESMTGAPLSVDERILGYLKGLNEPDERLSALINPVAAPEPPGPAPSQRKAVDEIVRRMEEGPSTGPLRPVQLLGTDARSKRDVAAVAMQGLGRFLLRMPVGLLPQDPERLDALGRLWHRESMLLPVALYIDAQRTPEGQSDEATDAILERFLARSDGVFLIGSRDIRRLLDRETAVVEVPRATPVEQREAWETALAGRAGPDAPGALAGQFDLAPATIGEITPPILAGENGDSAATVRDRIWEACLATTRPQLEALAQRIEPSAGWNDLVLPEVERRTLERIGHQVEQRLRVYQDWGFAERMQRGLGISALFCGPSGVGKTMAAEVLARELRLVLYRIDLASVVSKYIGETEKNLRALFDAAEESPALLLFDEADALFGRRSEVKDAHDRYANIEVAYLLQRMEAYRGLTILATNMRAAMDQAFLRRLRFTLTFPFPGPEQRREIWSRAFPQAAPTDLLNFDRLARLQVSGAMIQTIALNAAFRAAHRNEPVSMPMILDAARAEFVKFGLPVPERELAWEPHAVAGAAR
jgi:ATPase family associated with various cellular activities (AAA)